jgi:hypothetical protein
VVVPRDEVIGEPVPGVDGHLDEGTAALLEQQPAREPVLQSDLLGSAGDQEQDAIGRAPRAPCKAEKALLEGGRLARSGAAQGKQRPRAVVDHPALGGVESNASCRQSLCHVSSNLANGCDI